MSKFKSWFPAWVKKTRRCQCPTCSGKGFIPVYHEERVECEECRTRKLIEAMPLEPGMCTAKVVQRRLANRKSDDRRVVSICDGHTFVNLCWGGYENVAGIGETHNGLPTLRIIERGHDGEPFVHACPVRDRPENFNGWYGVGDILVAAGDVPRWPFGTNSVPIFDRMVDRKKLVGEPQCQ